jgi:DeoR family transcriptional regulator of aga operon
MFTGENRMLNLERHTKILELIDQRGKVEVRELSRLFRISEVTIRNDLKDLHKRGLVRRAHGGAVRIETVSVDATLQVKAALRADDKRRIGAAAAALIKDGDSVILDSGTTTQNIARQIKDRKELTVITNGINIAMELLGAKNIRLILLGGMVRQNSYSAVGHFAEDMLEQLSADKLFLAVDALDLDLGLSTPNPEESKVNQAMVQIATETILVADSSKFGKRSLSRIVPLSAIDKIITDSSLAKDFETSLRARGIEVVMV